jgi:hypothetical protein
MQKDTGTPITDTPPQGSAPSELKPAALAAQVEAFETEYEDHLSLDDLAKGEWVPSTMVEVVAALRRLAATVAFDDQAIERTTGALEGLVGRMSHVITQAVSEMEMPPGLVAHLRGQYGGGR